MIAALNRRLGDDLGELSQTPFFEYPSIEELAGYLLEECATPLARLLQGGASPQPSAASEDAEEEAGVQLERDQGAAPRPRSVATPSAQASGDDPLVIVGIAGRYPGASSLEELWENLKLGRDCICEVPAERWDHAPIFDANPRAKGKAYSR